jgi:single-stranded DNA-binding protein
MNLEITGRLLEVYETLNVSPTFKKREFVLDITEEINGNAYPNFAKMQLVQAKCDLIDKFKKGDMLKVNFNIKSNKWVKDGKDNYITNLDAWRIEFAQNQGQSAPPANNNYNNNNNNNYNNNSGGYNAGNAGGFGGNAGQQQRSGAPSTSGPQFNTPSADDQNDDLPF